MTEVLIKNVNHQFIISERNQTKLNIEQLSVIPHNSQNKLKERGKKSLIHADLRDDKAINLLLKGLVFPAQFCEIFSQLGSKCWQLS